LLVLYRFASTLFNPCCIHLCGNTRSFPSSLSLWRKSHRLPHLSSWDSCPKTSKIGNRSTLIRYERKI
jgi:hypothetical protein